MQVFFHVLFWSHYILECVKVYNASVSKSFAWNEIKHTVLVFKIANLDFSPELIYDRM